MSKENLAPQEITHESEAQRQHIRVHLPAIAKINGKSSKIKDISASGFSIEADQDFVPDKNTVNAKILFPFRNFAFHLNVKVAPVYHDKGYAGYRYVEMNTHQVSLLNHIIKSCLAGQIVQEGDLINVVARNNFVKAKDTKSGKNDNYTNSLWARLLPMGAILLACAAGFIFFLSNVYENTSVVKSYMGMVEGNIFTVRAPANGTFHSVLEAGTQQVTKDQPLGIVRSSAHTDDSDPSIPSGGQDFAIKSPCDCTIVAHYIEEGEFNLVGQPLMELFPMNGQTWVTASLPPEQAHRLQILDDAQIKIVGEGGFIEGNVASFMPLDWKEGLSKIRIKTKEPISPTMVGRMAYVEFIVN